MELMIGIIVTSIVLCALAVFIFGVGENWEASDSAQSAFLAASMGVDRLNFIVRSAQMIDANPTPGSLDNSSSPAACMMWTDVNLDGAIQYSEMTLLEYDSAQHLLAQYVIPATANNATTQVSAIMNAASFIALPNIVRIPVVHDVTACEIHSINATRTSIRPSLEFVLELATGSSSSKTLVYATSALRAPASVQ